MKLYGIYVVLDYDAMGICAVFTTYEAALEAFTALGYEENRWHWILEFDANTVYNCPDFEKKGEPGLY